MPFNCFFPMLLRPTLAALMSHIIYRLFPSHALAPVARIGSSNIPSITLFEKLGFIVTKRVEIFDEIEMRMSGRGESWARGEVHHVLFE